MQRISVLPLLRDDISNNPNGVLLDILILRMQCGNDRLHCYLIFHYCRNGLIFPIARQFPQRLEHYLEIAMQVAQQLFEGSLLLVGVVDQDP